MNDAASAAPSLLPCPMCGGAAALVKYSAGMPGTMGYDQWHGVSCRSCNVCVGARDRRFRERSDALAAWNRRAPQPMAREPLTASEVEHLLAQWIYTKARGPNADQPHGRPHGRPHDPPYQGSTS